MAAFTITGVPVGRVYLKAEANCQGQHGNLVDEWYAATGSTPDGTQASPIEVVAGQTVPNIDFTLDPAARSPVTSSRPTACRSSPMCSSACMPPACPAGTSSLGTYASQADGSYTISGLAPGTYKVQGNNNRVGYYISEYYNNKLFWDQADIITVEAGKTTAGIDFALEPGGAITGRVLEQDGVTPVANACVKVLSAAPNGNKSPASAARAVTEASPSPASP